MTVDTRHLVLTRDVMAFDAQILSLLRVSQVDGQPAADWLRSSSSSPQRVACLLNILAKLRSLDLLKRMQYILRVREERVYFVIDARLLGDLQTLVIDPEMPFYGECAPKNAIHQEIFDDIERQGLGSRTDYTLWSFRQEGRNCLQCVVAAPSISSSLACADCDIDLWDPLQDLVSVVGHAAELTHGVTDAMALHDGLMAQACGEYLYYDVQGE